MSVPPPSPPRTKPLHPREKPPVVPSREQLSPTAVPTMAPIVQTSFSQLPWKSLIYAEILSIASQKQLDLKKSKLREIPEVIAAAFAKMYGNEERKKALRLWDGFYKNPNVSTTLTTLPGIAAGYDEIPRFLNLLNEEIQKENQSNTVSFKYILSTEDFFPDDKDKETNKIKRRFFVDAAHDWSIMLPANIKVLLGQWRADSEHQDVFQFFTRVSPNICLYNKVKIDEIFETTRKTPYIDGYAICTLARLQHFPDPHGVGQRSKSQDTFVMYVSYLETITHPLIQFTLPQIRKKDSPIHLLSDKEDSTTLFITGRALKEGEFQFLKFYQKKTKGNPLALHKRQTQHRYLWKIKSIDLPDTDEDIISLFGEIPVINGKKNWETILKRRDKLHQWMALSKTKIHISPYPFGLYKDKGTWSKFRIRTIEDVEKWKKKLKSISATSLTKKEEDMLKEALMPIDKFGDRFQEEGIATPHIWLKSSTKELWFDIIQEKGMEEKLYYESLPNKHKGLDSALSTLLQRLSSRWVQNIKQSVPTTKTDRLTDNVVIAVETSTTDLNNPQLKSFNFFDEKTQPLRFRWFSQRNFYPAGISIQKPHSSHRKIKLLNGNLTQNEAAFLETFFNETYPKLKLINARKTFKSTHTDLIPLVHITDTVAKKITYKPHWLEGIFDSMTSLVFPEDFKGKITPEIRKRLDKYDTIEAVGRRELLLGKLMTRKAMDPSELIEGLGVKMLTVRAISFIAFWLSSWICGRLLPLHHGLSEIMVNDARVINFFTFKANAPHIEILDQLRAALSIQGATISLTGTDVFIRSDILSRAHDIVVDMENEWKLITEFPKTTKDTFIPQIHHAMLYILHLFHMAQYFITDEEQKDTTVIVIYNIIKFIIQDIYINISTKKKIPASQWKLLRRGKYINFLNKELSRFFNAEGSGHLKGTRVQFLRTSLYEQPQDVIFYEILPTSEQIKRSNPEAVVPSALPDSQFAADTMRWIPVIDQMSLIHLHLFFTIDLTVSQATYFSIFELYMAEKFYPITHLLWIRPHWIRNVYDLLRTPPLVKPLLLPIPSKLHELTSWIMHDPTRGLIEAEIPREEKPNIHPSVTLSHWTPSLNTLSQLLFFYLWMDMDYRMGMFTFQEAVNKLFKDEIELSKMTPKELGEFRNKQLRPALREYEKWFTRAGFMDQFKPNTFESEFEEEGLIEIPTRKLVPLPKRQRGPEPRKKTELKVTTETEDNPLNRCQICRRKASLTCSGCTKTIYCSKECQATDWTKNKHYDSCLLSVEHMGAE